MIEIVSSGINRWLTFCFLFLVLPSSLVWAGAPLQMDRDMSLFYFITHLHPTIYLILFCVFVLSMVNLFAQSHLPIRVGTFLTAKFKINFFGTAGGAQSFTAKTGRNIRPKGFGGSIRGPESYRMSKEPFQDGIVSMRSVPGQSDEVLPENIPTPLDGEDHPIPEFGLSSKPKSIQKPSSSSESERDKILAHKEFKFSSAVDLPSPEEIERREKEKIVVSGRVVDPSGSGLATAVVYLVDKDGNKIGQSCRTNSDDGSYRVQANDAGAHAVNVYRRGYVMNSDGPIKLPAKSGKIKTFDIPMLPEGCLIHGKVMSEADKTPLAGLTVKCSCRSERFTHTTTTNSSGAFQAAGAPLNSECAVQVLSPDGHLLLDSNPFETVQKKQIFLDLKVDFPIDVERVEGSEPYENVDEVLMDPESRTSVQSSAV